jgi:hypothetical protein
MDDCLSIDDNYDPESHIDVKYFEDISRVLDYKDILMRFVNRNKNAVRKDGIDKFEELLNSCDLTKKS